MNTDPIADMLTRIRNGLNSSKTQILIPYSKLKYSIVTTLTEQGYLGDVKSTKLGNFEYIQIKLDGAKKPITTVARVSKPGRRLYTDKNSIPKVLNGRGIVILSTPAGVMTGAQARQKGVGGELICEVW